MEKIDPILNQATRYDGSFSYKTNILTENTILASTSTRKLEKDINIACLLSAIVGVLSLPVNSWQPLRLFSSIMLLLVCIGLYIKSRICAMTLLIVNVVVLAAFIVVLFCNIGDRTVVLISLVIQLTFFYFVFGGIKGVFDHHKQLRKLI